MPIRDNQSGLENSDGEKEKKAIMLLSNGTEIEI